MGKLKFYNDKKEYGFVTTDKLKDIFIHKDDLIKAGINTKEL